MRYFALFVILFIGRLSSIAQTELSQSPMNVPSLISPYYFGPNAFPVPDMLDGRVEDELRIFLTEDDNSSFCLLRGLTKKISGYQLQGEVIAAVTVTCRCRPVSVQS